MALPGDTIDVIQGIISKGIGSALIGLKKNTEQLVDTLLNLNKIEVNKLDKVNAQTYAEILDRFESLRSKLYKYAIADYKILNYNKSNYSIADLKSKFSNVDFDKYELEINNIDLLIRDVTKFNVEVKSLLYKDNLLYNGIIATVASLGLLSGILLGVFAPFAVIGHLVVGLFCLISGTITIGGVVGIINDLVNRYKDKELKAVISILEEIRNRLLDIKDRVGDMQMVVSDILVDKDFVTNYDLLIDNIMEVKKLSTKRYK